jgi:putative tryptophan/tyrosine transport system substrate-binding protein
LTTGRRWSELQRLDPKISQEVELHVQGGTADPQQARANVRTLLRLKPDLMIVASTPGVAAALQETSQVPLVFVNVADPVGSGFVPQLARPNGNITGFTNFGTSMAGTWVELLRELVPGIQHLLAIYDPLTTPNNAYPETARSAAQTASLQLATAAGRSDDQVEVVRTPFACRVWI